MNDSEIEAQLTAHFSAYQRDVVAPEDALLLIIEKGRASKAPDLLRSPYLISFAASYAAQRFAFSFVTLLVVVGIAAGSLKTKVFDRSTVHLFSRIPVFHEICAKHIEETLLRREQSADDEDFAAPESQIDSSLKSFDVYNETNIAS